MEKLMPLNFFNMSDEYQFEDVDSSSEPSSEPSASEPGSEPGSGTKSSSGNGYAAELFTKQIKAKFRTFFVDLKESSNGKFVKISEKSHGRKSTIMMDAEDVPQFIEAFQEIEKKL